ncbi:hypothetical protein DACRYDRAFT_82988 [Dacryopinax primogenitus]|uniref:Glycosyl transferase family 25 domain-containing protein n=1 Tax=Dacryopinax primogenitus (strain DJM 731) TaxID=1858805 RepID=M5FSY4_DACPD|nr:uncharacterized protein DACRYDRAFT_82988 [Dacryopinax primogenitus]EJT99078.1 hypothetical protein DACRYDRAFT_82988 [Dacryopinax primogenitus]
MILLKSRQRVFIACLVFGVVCLLCRLTIWDDASGSIPGRWTPIFRSLTFRERVASIRAADRYKHSKSLGVFSRIYVVSLPSRIDRRERMQELAEALGIDVEYWNATDKNSPLVADLMERRRQRIQLDTSTLQDLDKARNSTRKSNAIWPSDVLANQDNPLASPLGLKFADLWELSPSAPHSSALIEPLPLSLAPDNRPAIPCAGPDDGLYAPQTPQEVQDLPPWRILSPGMLACWHSHVGLLRRFTESHDDAILILEDDVDVEFDIETRLHRVWTFLPKDWDAVYLGHCWSAEQTHPSFPEAPAIRPSYTPKCTHAYAVSRRGAYRLIRHLRAPAFAYSRALDQAYVYLIQRKRIKAFSFYPSIAIQTKDLSSDIFPGNGSSWRDLLADSTMERIQLVQEHGSA